MDGIDINQVMHDGRTAYLRDIDATGKVMISIGSNSSGYFSWIKFNSGEPDRHIGVEYYMPRPDSLPEKCEWVVNSAGDMRDVGDGMGDILFSGQNIEHLWEEDVVGFLMEANRVLKSGGLAIVDSPNRAITAALCIVHPEHMVELLPDEMAELFMAAGFEVTARRGIYLCRDPRNGQILPYQPEKVMGGVWSVTERLALSDRHVDDSFIWWIEARKTGAPDLDRLRMLVRRYWEIGWPERMDRLLTECGARGEADGIVFLETPAGFPSAVAYGPYAPIKRGRHHLEVRIALTEPADKPVIGQLEVLLGLEIVAAVDIPAASLVVGDYRPITIDFDTSLETTFGFQWRVISDGSTAMRVERRTRIEKVE